MVCYIWSDWSEYTNLVVSILVLEEGNHPELNLQIVLSSISMPWDDFAMSMFAPGEIRISVCYWGRWVFNQQGFLWRFNSSRIMGNKCIVHINSFENMFSNQPRKSRSTVILLEGQCPIRSIIGKLERALGTKLRGKKWSRVHLTGVEAFKRAWLGKVTAK